MSTAQVGFVFALLVGAREWWRWYRPRAEARRDAIRTCEAIGHDWQDPVTTAFGEVRSCRRCKRQDVIERPVGR
jgi:hypothetical protein